MKYLCIIFCLIFFADSTAMAQKIRYTDTTNIWTLTFDVWDADSQPMSSYDLFYVGDTVMNSLIYYKQNYGLWVREDTTAGKVFYWDSFVNGEKLLFDYNLAIGDTLLSYSDTFILQSIDSVLLNNIPHVVQYFGWLDNGSVGFNNGMIIEGLGSMEEARRLIPPHVNPGYTISCFENQGLHPTVNPAIYSFFENNNSCNVLSVKGIEDNVLLPKVVPNPANRTSSIVFGKPFSGDVTIVNCLGQQVASKQIINGSQFFLNETELSPAVYFYWLVDEDTKEVFTGKFCYE